MAIQDDAKQFFLTELSRSQGDLPSLQLEWLTSKGYTRGSIDERWSYYLRDNGQPPAGVSWDFLGLTRNKGGGATLDVDAVAYIAALTGSPSAAYRTAYSDFVKALKAAGAWEKLRGIYLRRNFDEQASLLNVKQPGTYTTTKFGTPVFTADVGWAIDGVTGYLIPGFTMAQIATQDDHAFGVLTTNATECNQIIGNSDNTMWIRYTTSQSLASRSASTTTNTTTSVGSTAPGHLTISRLASGNYKQYRNGSPLATITQTSAALTASEMREGRASSEALSGTPSIRGSYYGLGLSDAQVSAIHDAFLAYYAATP